MKKILLFLLLIPFISFSQNVPGEGLVVVEFNAPFSNSKCEYLNKLSDASMGHYITIHVHYGVFNLTRF